MVWAGVENPTSSHGIRRPENEREKLGLPAVLAKESKVIQRLEIHLSCLLSICWTRGGAASRVCVGNVPGAGRHSPLQPGSGGGGFGGLWEARWARPHALSSHSARSCCFWLGGFQQSHCPRSVCSQALKINEGELPRNGIRVKGQLGSKSICSRYKNSTRKEKEEPLDSLNLISTVINV